jgi:hypothetical protein
MCKKPRRKAQLLIGAIALLADGIKKLLISHRNKNRVLKTRVLLQDNGITFQTHIW